MPEKIFKSFPISQSCLHRDIINVVAIEAFNFLRRKSHCNDAVRNEGQIQIKSTQAITALLFTDETLKWIRHAEILALPRSLH